ncbi:metallophosphoesterase [Pelagicoccus mobilis]|uniref:Metallophosphoesterase n=1 Tax=Pelagicoccus mobilis TaxID=415221 RepID=A0A934VLI8_9BACT|nr:metallophosphoesterase [Pelagicoccus mobilis]MBK1877791.1 metallophosphoesterase [Pelagicoccus mobilis]
MSHAAKPALVIPDTHQNIDWVEAILVKESAEVSQVVFLGDYLDAKVKTADTPEATARYIANLQSRYPELPITFLVGNHDLPYLYDLQNDRSPESTNPNPYSNGAYVPAYSEQVREHFNHDFLSQLKPFALVEGFLMSHAGLHIAHFPVQTDDALQTLYTELNQHISKLPDQRPPALAAVGIARRGLDPIGGLAWQDWFHEFEDSLPWPQIVGHTLLDEPDSRGRSWNLDTRNGSYALIQNATIQIRALPKE